MKKINMGICLMLFFITLTISHVLKPNINQVNREHLTMINGIGKIKSERIIVEREIYGVYKNREDFAMRTEPLGIGKVSFDKIQKKYKFGD